MELKLNITLGQTILVIGLLCIAFFSDYITKQPTQNNEEIKEDEMNPTNNPVIYFSNLSILRVSS